MDNNLVGQTIQGRYYVVKQLGRGGLGVTFLAQDQQCFNSPCVVKQLKPKTLNPKTLTIARRLFNREAEIMNRLGDCDRIPRLLAYFEQDTDFFLVQELIEGHDLSREIIPGQAWSESKTIALVRDVLEVLLVVQQHSVIHRDLKPSNLMRRSQDDKIILIDFGSVKQVSTQIIDAAGQIKQTVAVGTQSYMPMEQMMGRPGFYSDIYALGVIAIQALTGISPKKLAVDQQGEIIWRSRLNSQVNYQPRFLDILDKMIRYRHQERYSSAGAVLADLQQLDVAQNNNKKTVIVSQRNSSPQQTQQSPNISQEQTLITNKSSPASSNLVNQTSVVKESGKSERPRRKTTGLPLTSSIQPDHALQGNTKKAQSTLVTGIIGFLAIIVAAWGGWILLQRQSSEPEVELSFYEDSGQDFRIGYPDDWSQQNRNDFFATGVVFFSPLENDSDQFKERVSILVEDLGEISLEQYTEESLAEIKRLSDPNVGEAQSITIGQESGRKIVYEGSENGSAVRRMQAWSVKDKQAYVLTYTARPESYETYFPTVERMIESFETVRESPP